ncbi:hypothetical protein [uncultured Campylobacter sp.]|uniref:hypothetical protein n=1 Tax=uncultured Campylobacter sp. TaxID=218934 RepID=UPI00262D3937|nr:hypothetical protein [uncultured Campylobacter sp.]
MILICTALRCEAQAIIESFKLTRNGDLFAGEQMLLYICGVRFGAKFKVGAAGGIEIGFKSEPGAEFICRADTDAEFGRELRADTDAKFGREDRRGADAKFKHSSDTGALCDGDAETGSAQNATENFEILNFNSAQNSERFGEILLSRRVDFALNIGVCGCADKGVQIGEAFYFDGTAAQEFYGEDGSKFYSSQVGEHSTQAPKFQKVCEREFCGASLDGKLRANLICVSEPKILNAAQRTRGASVAAIEACGEINAQAPTQDTNGAADTKNFTRDATRAAIQSATQVEAQNLASIKPSQIAVGECSAATNTAARAIQNTPCTAKDATCGRVNHCVTLYDMESVFFVNACERAGVPWAMMKIVSDHLRGERLSKSFVYELVKARLPQIRAAIKSEI